MPVPDESDPRPAYLQIADDIRDQVASGKLVPPARLRPQREMADEYGVAPETLRRAVEVLAREGVLATGSTRGTFVLRMPGTAPDVAAELADLRAEVGDLREKAASGDGSDVLERVGRIEANLMDLYGKLGYEYPGNAPARKKRKAAGS